jgi:TonB-linked SusC/RagA family outer membrane protein
MRKILHEIFWCKCIKIIFFLFIFMGSAAFAQQTNKVTGKIIASNDNVPLPGVTITVKDTPNGTVSNADGIYAIDAKKGSVLVYSYTGFEKKEVVIGDETKIDVTLEVKANSLNEVVVVGYGTQKKINVTGSVATLKAKDIEGVPVSNISSDLVGRLPGFTAVNRGGEPGNDVPEISIRGFENMLVIVDGVQADFNNLSPSEIESISILKDASASIYGARAGNGVLLVTTKRGKQGKPAFSLTANQGWQAPTVIARRVDAATFATMSNVSQAAVGGALMFSDEQIQKYRDGNDPAYPNTDWYNEVFKKAAPIRQYDLTSSGGNDDIKYFFSVGYLNQGGLLKSGDFSFNRLNIRSNIDVRISKSFSASLDISGRNEQRNSPGSNIGDGILQDISFAQPIYAPYFPDHNYPANAGHAGSQPIARADSKFTGYANDNRKYANIIATFNYKAPFLDGLTAKAMFSSNLYYGYIKAFNKAFSVYDYDAETQTYTQIATQGNDQLNEVLGRSTDLTTQLSANYNKKVGLHEFNILALSEFISNSSNNLSAHREGFLTTDIDQLFAGSQLNKDNDGSAYNDGRIGYVTRLNYSYAGKYLVEGSVRYDASARYISTRRWAYFPGVSVGWRLSRENFLKDVSFIDDLKLRGSYGRAGNDYVGQFNYLTGFNFGGNYVFGENPGISTGIISKGLANADLTWERTATSNIGLDGSFLKGLIGFEFDVFYRKVTDVAGTRILSLPSTVGATLPQENINSYDNRGFELVLKHENSIGKDFKYNISANVSYTRSKWVHFDEPTYTDQPTRDRLQISGKFKDQVFGYTALGLFQSQEEINAWGLDQDGSKNSTIKPGDIKYEDFNHDGVLDDKDNHVIGQGFTPTVYYGLNLGAQYKGVSLSVLMQGAANFNAYFTDVSQSAFFNGTVPLKYMADYWTPENTDAKYPRLYPGGAPNNQFLSTYWLQNATYLRVKTIQAGYTFTKGFTTKLGINSLKLYVSGYNLFTFDNIYPYDPESGAGRGWFYPQQKSYNIGVNVTF